ncbi:uncharacterized protein [Euwallacea fornicatus]|uniref:uncharacterized protein isoform X2 n=1 Tax=Euwallacea fornicatus TaxID=995702 RepID=UPI00338D6D47
MNVTQNEEEISFLQNELSILEEEDRRLDELIACSKARNERLSLELTHKTEKEIQSNIDCKKSQSACEALCKTLDEVNRKLRDTLTRYDPDSHFVNFIDMTNGNENIRKICSLVAPLIDPEHTIHEKSDDYLSLATSKDLEICRRRILRSCQIYLANQVEIEKLKAMLDFLLMVNVNENNPSWDLINSQESLAAKEVFKKGILEILDGVALKMADYHLKEIKVHYLERELEYYRKRFKYICDMLDNLTKQLSYYVLTNYLQLVETKDVECINDLLKRIMEYIDDDLGRCHSRTEKMKRIDDYNLHMKKPLLERCQVASSIIKILGGTANSLESAAEIVGQFKAELNSLQLQIFSSSFSIDEENVHKMRANVNILEEFLSSGPTDKIILIPTNLQKVCLQIEEHLKKEKESIDVAVGIPKIAVKSMKQSAKLIKELWMNFLINPSKVEHVLLQAEEDFNKRNCEYF